MGPTLPAEGLAAAAAAAASSSTAADTAGSADPMTSELAVASWRRSKPKNTKKKKRHTAIGIQKDEEGLRDLNPRRRNGDVRGIDRLEKAGGGVTRGFKPLGRL